jgi:hypothetical protein
MAKRDQKLGRHAVYISEEAHKHLMEAVSISGLSKYELLSDMTLRHAKVNATAILRQRLSDTEEK